MDALMPNSHAANDGPLFFSPPATKPPRKPRERRDADWRFDPQEVFALKDPRLRSVPFLTLSEVSKLTGKNSGAIWSDCVTYGRYPYWRRGERYVLFLQPWAHAIVDAILAIKDQPPLFGITEMPPWTKKPRWLVAEPVPAAALGPVSEPEPAPAPDPPEVQAMPEPEAPAEPVEDEPTRLPIFHTEAWVARHLRLPRETVAAAIESGELPASRLRGEVRIAESDVAAWIQQTRCR